MSIVDDLRLERIVVQTDQGQVTISPNFSIENNQPIHGLVKVTDLDNRRIYWFNINAISWIGPAQ